MNLFICKGCDHIAVGAAPDKCPVCGAPKSSFSQNDNVFKEAEEKSKEGAVKHIPSITVNKDCGMIPEGGCTDILVRVGETLHPMLPEHFIQFIDCYVDGQYVARALLSAASQPAVIFHIKESGSKVQIVEYCNLHGHWMAEASL